MLKEFINFCRKENITFLEGFVDFMLGVLAIFRHDLGQNLLLRTYGTYAGFRTTVVFDKLPQISCAYMFPKAILKDLLTPDPVVSHADIWHQVPEQIFAPCTHYVRTWQRISF